MKIHEPYWKKQLGRDYVRWLEFVFLTMGQLEGLILHFQENIKATGNHTYGQCESYLRKED